MQLVHRASDWTPWGLVKSLRLHWPLIVVLARREVLGRYQGSIAGLLWSFFNPLLMLAVYTFVFSVVFKARWGMADTGSKSGFALALFAGLIPFGIFSECVTRAPGLIVGNASYVKKVVFPLEILPVVILVSAAFHALVSMAVWIAFFLWTFHGVHGSIILLPLVYLPLMLLVLGLSWGLASLGVYLRDVVQVVGVAVTALMFLTPIFYPIDAIPPGFRHVMTFNPMTTIVEMSRNLMMSGVWPDWGQWAKTLLVTSAVAAGGFAWFQRTKKGFADVL